MRGLTERSVNIRGPGRGRDALLSSYPGGGSLCLTPGGHPARPKPAEGKRFGGAFEAWVAVQPLRNRPIYQLTALTRASESCARPDRAQLSYKGTNARTVVNAGLGRILGGVPGAATGCAVISKVSKTEQSGGISAILGVSRGGRKRAFFIRI